MPRLFFALNLPVEVKELVGEVQSQLRQRIPDGLVRWQDKNKPHLTLRFLGQVTDAHLPVCRHAVMAASQKQNPFYLETTSLGVFPSRRRPSVLWLGIGGDLSALTDLHDALDYRLSNIGSHQESKGFHPHLTLGRMRHSSREAKMPLIEALELVKPKSVGWQVDQVELIESKLHPSGASYHMLATGRFASP
jgi:2'-5' RNA ligase